MYTEGFDQLFKVNKGLTIPLSNVARLTTEICRSSAQKNLELFGENLLLLSEQLKRLSCVKKPEDWVAIQKDYVNESITVGVESLQKILSTSMENIAKLTEIYGTLRKPIETATEHMEHATHHASHHLGNHIKKAMHHTKLASPKRGKKAGGKKTTSVKRTKTTKKSKRK